MRAATTHARSLSAVLGLVALVLGLLTTAAPAQAATTYYVNSSTGKNIDDGVQGRSAAKPWLTAQYAVNTAPAGSRVQLADGNYAPFTITRALTVAGSAKAIVRGATIGQNVVNVNASNVTLTGFAVVQCRPQRRNDTEDNGTAQIRVNDGTSNTKLLNLSIDYSHLDDGSAAQQMIGCYGVLVHGASDVTVSGSYIAHNGTGVFVRSAGANIKILNNTIVDNDVLIRSTGNGIYGGEGVFVHGTRFVPSSGKAGPLVQGNTLYGNVADAAIPPTNTDGGATEIYASTYTTFRNNTIHDNDDVFESGTDGNDCSTGNQFVYNTAWGKSDGTLTSPSQGLYIRCGLKVDHNDFGVNDPAHNLVSGLNYHAIAIAGNDGFSGSLSGLTITNNSVFQPSAYTNGPSEFTYQVDGGPTLTGVTIDNNCFSYRQQFAKTQQTAGGSYNTLATLSAWRSQYQRYGFDKNSLDNPSGGCPVRAT